MAKAATQRPGRQEREENTLGVSTKNLLLNAGIGHKLHSALALIKEDTVLSLL